MRDSILISIRIAPFKFVITYFNTNTTRCGSRVFSRGRQIFPIKLQNWILFFYADQIVFLSSLRDHIDTIVAKFSAPQRKQQAQMFVCGPFLENFDIKISIHWQTKFWAKRANKM